MGTTPREGRDIIETQILQRNPHATNSQFTQDGNRNNHKQSSTVEIQETYFRLLQAFAAFHSM